MRRSTLDLLLKKKRHSKYKLIRFKEIVLQRYMMQDYRRNKLNSMGQSQ